MLGELPAFPQAIKNLFVGGMRIEPVFGKIPQPRVGAVVESQPTFAVEDRYRSGELVERIGMSVDVLLQPRFGIAHICDVDGRANNLAVCDRHLGERERAALSSDHGKTLGFDGMTLRQRGGGQITFGLFDRRLIANRCIHIVSRHRGEKGAVSPAQHARRIPHPHGNWQDIDHGAEIRFRFASLGLHPHGGHVSHGATTQRDGIARFVTHAEPKRRPVLIEQRERVGQFGGIRAG